MAKQKNKKAPSSVQSGVANTKLDNNYFLKLVLYLVVGSFWLKITAGGTHIPIPIGLIIGLLFARHESLQVDKKIEYAVLLAAMLVGYFAPFGLYINL